MVDSAFAAALRSPCTGCMGSGGSTHMERTRRSRSPLGSRSSLWWRGPLGSRSPWGRRSPWRGRCCCGCGQLTAGLPAGAGRSRSASSAVVVEYAALRRRRMGHNGRSDPLVLARRSRGTVFGSAGEIGLRRVGKIALVWTRRGSASVCISGGAGPMRDVHTGQWFGAGDRPGALI